jgi:hypothetical protein
LRGTFGQKKPQPKPGLEAFSAVTHQGPAQGGKAGGGEPPKRNLTKMKPKFKVLKQKNTCPVSFETKLIFSDRGLAGWIQAQFFP